jgi:hypothetical protein
MRFDAGQRTGACRKSLVRVIVRAISPRDRKPKCRIPVLFGNLLQQGFTRSLEAPREEFVDQPATPVGCFLGRFDLGRDCLDDCITHGNLLSE